MTLAQIIPNTPIPSLPSPPPGVYYVVENPWPLSIILVLLAIPAYALLNARRQFRLAPIVSALLVLAGGGVFIAAMLVKTEREVLRERTAALAEAALAARTVEVGEMLMQSANVSAFSIIPGPQGREAILDAIRQYLGEQYPIDESRIGTVQAHLDGQNVARTQVRVWAKPKKDQRLYDAMTGAWFRLDWQRDPLREGGYGPWKVGKITVLQLDTVGANPQID